MGNWLRTFFAREHLRAVVGDGEAACFSSDSTTRFVEQLTISEGLSRDCRSADAKWATQTCSLEPVSTYPKGALNR